jgi:PAS domain-containing protein
VATERRLTPAPLEGLLFDPSPETELRSALEALATRMRRAVDVAIVAFVVVDEIDTVPSVLGLSIAPDADPTGALFETLSADAELLGLFAEATDTAAVVNWPRLVDEPRVLDRLTQLAEAGHNAARVRRLLNGASAVAVPLGTPNTPRLGAVALISLDPRQPTDTRLVERLAEVAPRLALTVRNHQWRDRNRRSRLIHEAVVEGSPNGIIITDLRGRVTTVNQAASTILDVDLSLIVGRPLREVIEQLAPSLCTTATKR